jgi:hypothetical protein
MSHTATILACCVVTSILSGVAQALPGSPLPAQMAASGVILVSGGCGHGFHHDPDGGCAPNGVYDYIETKFFGLPYLAPPNAGLPYVSLPNVGVPYIGPPNTGLPYIGPPNVGLPYVGPPNVGLPYITPPNVGLPYIGPPEYVAPRTCPYGYAYSAHRCVPT